MFATAATFMDLVCAALTAGAMFGLWLGLRGPALPAALYVAQQQQLIRGMNVAMPLLGASTVILTLVCAFQTTEERSRLALLLTSAACFLAAGLITRFLNQPINAVVLSWPTDAPPQHWERLRDAWWRWHVRRTLFGFAGFCLLVAATLVATGRR